MFVTETKCCDKKSTIDIARILFNAMAEIDICRQGRNRLNHHFGRNGRNSPVDHTVQ